MTAQRKPSLGVRAGTSVAWPRWMGVVVALGVAPAGCGSAAPDVEPIRWAVLDVPPFAIRDTGQVGTILISEQRGTEAPIELVVGRFTPMGDTGDYHQLASEGDCRLFDRSPGFCDRVCDVDSFCLEGTCRPYPTFVDVGAVALTGLAAPYAIEIVDWGTGPIYVGRTAAEPDDLFDAGSPIDVTIAGGSGVPAIDVTAFGVESLNASVHAGDVVVLPRADDTTFRWDPSPTPASRVRLTLRSKPLETHGLTAWTKLVCDVPDTDGQLVVPGGILGLVPELVEPVDSVGMAWPGGAPWKESSLTRYASTSVATSTGSIEIVTANEILFWAVHPGPCSACVPP